MLPDSKTIESSQTAHIILKYLIRKAEIKNGMEIGLYVHKIHQFVPDRGKNTQYCCEAFLCVKFKKSE